MPRPTPCNANTNASAPAWPAPVTSAKARWWIAPGYGTRARAISGHTKSLRKPLLWPLAQNSSTACARQLKIGVASKRQLCKWKSCPARSSLKHSRTLADANHCPRKLWGLSKCHSGQNSLFSPFAMPTANKLF